MNLMELMAISGVPYLQADEARFTLPEWAKAEMWLGWWCRRFQAANARLVVVAVLPCRDLASAFSALGCLVSGAQSFCGELTWEKFTSLPPGTEIFWQTHQSNSSYGGQIIDSAGWPSGVVPVHIVKCRRSTEVGSTIGFSHHRFDECIFSEVRLPVGQRRLAMEAAVRFQRELGVDVSARWSLSGGVECCLMTNQAEFSRQLAGIQLGSDNGERIFFLDALHVGKLTDNSASKIALASVGHYSERHPPVTILDGPAAFQQISLVETGNVIVLLERSEYNADVRNLLLELKDASEEDLATTLTGLPARLPPSMEVTAFIVPARH